MAPIFLRYRDNLLRYIQSKVRDEVSREDLLSEIMLKLYDQCERLDQVVNVEAWLLGIARNTVNDYFRNTSRYAEAPVLERGEETDSDLSEKVDIEACVHSMIGLLPDKYQGPLYDYEIKGIPQKELAARYHLSESGIKSRVQRGRVMLKDLFGRYCAEVTSQGCDPSGCSSGC